MNTTAATETSTELVPRNVYEIVEAQEARFKTASSDEAIVWAKESQFAMQALQLNDTLNSTAWRNQNSLQAAIVNVASVGITLNPAAKHAYLVPRDGRVCLDISYMGLMHLAQAAGSILWGQAKLVRKNDFYQNLGIDQQPAHKYDAFASHKERGEIIGVYCTVKTTDGSFLTEEMSLDDIYKVKSSSKAANGPWVKWFDEMCRKSVVKRASKYWPRTSQNNRLDHAIDVLNQHEGIAQPGEKDITPISETPHEDLKSLLVQRKADPKQYLPWLSKQFGRTVTDLNQLSDQEAGRIARHMEKAA